MKRFHVHLGVDDLAQSIRFYTGLFGAEPSVRKEDYAKWMIDDPRLNFAISQRGSRVGLNHLGLQVDSADELAAVRNRFADADRASVEDQPGASCCYARSDKHWVTDPQGIAWEGYHTLGDIQLFGGDDEASRAGSACCASSDAVAVAAAPHARCCAPASSDTAAVDSLPAAGCCAPASRAGVDATTASTAVPSNACCR